MATISYKCPACGGGLQFDPDSQKFKCEYCLSKFTEVELEAVNPMKSEDRKAEPEEIQTEAAPEAQNAEGLMAYSCPSCGAEVMTDETTAATFCYYCHNPVVLTGRLDGVYKPSRLIPFSITKKQAEEKFLEWTGKKWFVPKYFFSKKQIETITGVYFPHWIVDADMQASMNAEGRIISTWRTGNTEYTKTKVYQVIREGEVHLEDVTRPALKKGNKELVDGIHPFDEKKIIPFSMGYLSGFQAEKRDIERTELESGVNQEIINLTGTLLAGTAEGYVGINEKDARVNIKNAVWEYVLFPVWTLTYKGRNGQIYYYAMNGDSGKMCGKLPVDYRKLGLVCGAVTAVTFLISTIVGYLL